MQTAMKAEQTMAYTDPEVDTDPKREILPSLRPQTQDRLARNPRFVTASRLIQESAVRRFVRSPWVFLAD